MREAFESALRDNPDDLAGWCAYADWLAEQGDPRGEFMQTQIALEDEARPKDERDRLKAREAELLTEYEREWLGPLAPHLLPSIAVDQSDPNYDWEQREKPSTHYRWQRGFLGAVTAHYLSTAFAQALMDAPVADFLRELRLHDIEHHYEQHPGPTVPRYPTPTGAQRHCSIFELIGSRCLRSLRVFYLGDEEAEPPEDGWCDCHTYAPDLHHVIASMPRVEELHLLCKDYENVDLFALDLPALRVLRVYHLGGYNWGRRYEYALDVLSANPALANLTHLLFHPHQHEGLGQDGLYHSYLPLEQVRVLVRSPHLKKLTHLQLRLSDAGDEGIREFIVSGILKQLKWLDLRHGAVTDQGAELLARCTDAKKLERIDLSRNAITARGLSRLRKANINAVANRPLTNQELEDREYLREGDFE